MGKFSDPIHELSNDLRDAGQKMRHAADRAVQRESLAIEASAKSIHAPIVATYSEQGAHVGGTERRGVHQDLSGSRALAGHRIDRSADELAGELAEQGVGAITQ